MKSKSRWLINAFAAIAALASWTVHAAERSHPARDQTFRLVKGDVVVFTGGTNTVRAVKAGHLETLLTRRFAGARPRFRDLSWEGDTVFRQATVADRWREEAFGGWPRQLKRIGTTVILAQFGQLEALNGEARLEEFVAAYERLLTQFAKQTRRIVLISPTPFEKAAAPLPDLSRRNTDLGLYVEAIRGIASRRGLSFVDLFTGCAQASATSPRTANGVHLLPQAQAVVAARVAGALGDEIASRPPDEALHGVVVVKNRLWFDYWRPANWKCLFGDDSGRVFGQAAGGHPSFREEWEQFPALIEKAENRIWELANAK